MPELYEHFYCNNIKAEMFASEWIFGLFSSVIPLELMTDFWSNFFENGWIFFYQLVLQIMREHEEIIKQEGDVYCILHCIKA